MISRKRSSLPSAGPGPGAATDQPVGEADRAGDRRTATSSRCATEAQAREERARSRLKQRRRGRSAAPAARSSASGRRNCSRCGWRNSSAGGSSRFSKTPSSCLILVLFGLIAAEVVLERASARGLSAAQHVFFAWADLAVCSVFLFEFTLKLALAPHRGKLLAPPLS